jgi:hypothetical protein
MRAPPPPPPASPHHDARATVCGIVSILSYIFLFRKIIVRVIFLSAVFSFSGLWAVTNSDVGCTPRLIRPALYKQA